MLDLPSQHPSQWSHVFFFPKQPTVLVVKWLNISQVLKSLIHRERKSKQFYQYSQLWKILSGYYRPSTSLNTLQALIHLILPEMLWIGISGMSILQMRAWVRKGSSWPQLTSSLSDRAGIWTQRAASRAYTWTALVVQWIIPLPMLGTWVQFLVWEDSTCHGATKPLHSY